MAANVRFSNPRTMAKPPGYSYVVEETGPNRLIFIAGQLGLDLDNKLVGAPGDFTAQAEKAVDNLKLALADAGATIKDVVKINNYLVDMSHIGLFRAVPGARAFRRLLATEAVRSGADAGVLTAALALVMNTGADLAHVAA